MCKCNRQHIPVAYVPNVTTTNPYREELQKFSDYMKRAGYKRNHVSKGGYTKK